MLNLELSGLSKKKVLIFGLGLQGGGVGDALWLHKQGARVRITDRKSEKELASSLNQLPSGISQSLGGHSDLDIDWADLIIKNPGVPDDEPHIQRARSLNKPVYTSIALFVSLARSKTVGITGTRGKSTTTELIFRLLDSAYPGQVKKGGNIPGTSGLQLLEELSSTKYFVLELSSFQLHNFHELEVSPHVAVMTNIYPDHLNRYPSMAAYQLDKEAIFRYQQPGDIAIRFPQASIVPSDWQLQLLGKHNRENVAGMLLVSRALKLSDQLARSVAENFRGLPYRLETIKVINGITFINDTTSSTPTAAIKAVQAVSGPKIMIVGGQSKNLPFQELVNILGKDNSVSKLVILGSRDTPDFVQELQHSCSQKIVGQVDSMSMAVKLAADVARPGDTVLLSPGFTSFDLFPNEFDRGRQFNDCVNKLSL